MRGTPDFFSDPSTLGRATWPRMGPRRGLEVRRVFADRVHAIHGRDRLGRFTRADLDRSLARTSSPATTAPSQSGRILPTKAKRRVGGGAAGGARRSYQLHLLWDPRSALLAPWGLAPWGLAPSRLLPLPLAPWRLAPSRLAPSRLAPSHLAPSRLALVRNLTLGLANFVPSKNRFIDLGAASLPLSAAPRRARRVDPHAEPRWRRGRVPSRSRRLGLVASGPACTCEPTETAGTSGAVAPSARHRPAPVHLGGISCRT